MKKISQRIAQILCLATLLQNCGSNPTAPPPAPSPAEPIYNEPHRPQIHFSPPEKWMNDPNGMVFFEGEYHLFYQYFPDSTVWGPMHWGHAVSADLLRWQHLPIALAPDSIGYIFSGSAVVDWQNSSGLGQDGKPPLVAIFTQHKIEGERAGRKDFQSQSIAVSHDRGRTWTKFEGNPVIPNPGAIKDFRDPKVSWHEASRQWVMVLAVGDHVEFWGAPDLKNWKKLSEFGKNIGAHGGVWECPDLFPMTSADGHTHWVLLVSINPGSPNGGSGTQYFVGDFDGKDFKLDPDFQKNLAVEKAIWLEHGRDNYAGVTWSDMPKTDGRRLLLGWMSNWDYAQVVPTERWRSANTLPRELFLKNTEKGWRIFSQPARELARLRRQKFDLAADTELDGSLDLTEKLGFAPAVSEWILEFDLTNSTAKKFGIELSNAAGERYSAGFDRSTNQFFSDRTRAGDSSFSKKFAAAVHLAPRLDGSEIVRLHLFFDRSSAEIFADSGSVAMTDLFFPSSMFGRARLFSDGGQVRVRSGAAFALASVWQ